MGRARLENFSKLVRHYILASTTNAGSGHPSSSLSAVELMTTLLFGDFFRSDLTNPNDPSNDRLIFSKGHAAPLLYALYAVAGAVDSEELGTLRDFGSRLEGHPTLRFPYTEAATGSLGQGLSIGLGMALNAKHLDKLSYRTYVLLGDSEMSEGSVWEAMASAAYYKLDNLIGVIDVNRLGQRGETMCGHDTSIYEQRAKSFGWETVVIDGHDCEAIARAYAHAGKVTDKPFMIIAKTIKGKGVSFLEDANGWHGKVLSEDELERAQKELGDVDKGVTGGVQKPDGRIVVAESAGKMVEPPLYDGTPIATRRAYGNALARLFPQFPEMVVLDAETSNSTYAEIFKKKYPNRFFEMFVAEQNMVGVALGLSRRGKKPFISTFAAFFSRAFDQIRMSQYSDANIVFVGSHAGVSIGEDGASQMGLEDIAMFRTIQKSVVVYPSDAYACERLTEEAARYDGMVYLRTTRGDAPILYTPEEQFPIGGSKTVCESESDIVTVVGAGITLHEALAAHDALRQEGVAVRVIDLYSIKPIDAETLTRASQETQAIIVVEDHVPEGGIVDAVRSVVSGTPVYSLAITNTPQSGTKQELLTYESISAEAIVRFVRSIVVH